ncbi:hypothetical protein CLV59_109239 [Chitinophaga dinghuensis]|uniref:Uncharacterized protein n=1 Tax=Chitinophaga dinghuensis TaxID=1539050 RepID=A0A327VP65_9BACT|nr:hypothetical protein CLV59_109239 [Chitinophaga dinghuensis]
MDSPSLIAIHNLSLGLMATIQFPAGKNPRIGNTIILEGITYKITGVVSFTSVETYMHRLEQNIHDCRIEKL